MARIRSIKPGYNKSLDIVGLSIPCRLHFVMLWTYADDEGRGIDHATLIRSELWGLDHDVTDEMVEGWQQELADAGRLVRYTAEGREYFEITGFRKHQKPNRPVESKIPAPPQREATFTPDAVSQPGELIPVVESRGEEKEGERSSALAVQRSESFEQFWIEYPRKIGKPVARRAYDKALKRATADEIISGLRRQVPSFVAKDLKFCPHPTTWLNRDGWNDELVGGPESAADQLTRIFGSAS